MPSSSDPAVPPQTYERITVYLRPEQRAWLEETLDRQVRDEKGRRIRSLSGSDIVRLAIDRLRAAVDDEGLPLVVELIAAANEDAETFVGRKNRGLPKR